MLRRLTKLYNRTLLAFSFIMGKMIDYVYFLFLAIVIIVIIKNILNIDFTTNFYDCINVIGSFKLFCNIDNTVERAHLNSIQVISTFSVSLLVFLIPLIMQFFDNQLKSNFGDSDVIFDIFKKHSKVKKLSHLLFLFIFYLYLQNTFIFWDLGFLKHIINMIILLLVIYQSLTVLTNYILYDSRINLIFKLYKYGLDNKLFSRRIIMYSIFNNMKYLMDSNNIEGLREFDRKLIRLLKEYDDSETSEVLSNSTPILRVLVQNSILKIKDDIFSFYDEIVSMFSHMAYYFDNYAIKRVFIESIFTIFYELDNYIWRAKIQQQSDYVKSSSLRNKKDKKTFDYCCRKIIDEFEEIKFIDVSYSNQDYIKYFDDIFNPYLNAVAKVVCCGVEEGNEDDIDNFLDMLLGFPNNNVLFKHFDNILLIPRLRFIDVLNLKNGTLELIDLHKELFFEEYKYLHGESNFNRYVFCNILNNFCIDVNFDLFSFLSYKHFESEDNKKNTFAIDVARNILYREPHMDSNFDIKISKPLSNFDNILVSTLKSFCSDECDILKDRYLEQYVEFFGDQKYSKNINLLRSELIKFKAIVLIVEYRDWDFNEYVKTIFDLNKSYRKISNFIFNINDLVTVLKELKYEDYYNSYIKHIFSESIVNKETFEQNSNEFIDSLEKMIKHFSEKIDIVDKRRNLNIEKIDYMEDFIIENYNKNIVNEGYYKIFKNNPKDVDSSDIYQMDFDFFMDKNNFNINRRKIINLYNILYSRFYRQVEIEVFRKLYIAYRITLNDNSKIIVNNDLKSYFNMINLTINKDRYVIFKNIDSNVYINLYRNKNEKASYKFNPVLAPFRDREIILSNDKKFNNLIICIEKKSFIYFNLINDSLKVSIDENRFENKILINFKVKYQFKIDPDIDMVMFSYYDKK